MDTCDHYSCVKTKAYVESLKDLPGRPVSKHVLVIFALSSSLVLKMSNKEDFKDLKAMKKDFPPNALVSFPSE